MTKETRMIENAVQEDIAEQIYQVVFTSEQIRKGFFDEGIDLQELVPELETVLDQAQGNLTGGKYQVAYVILKIVRDTEDC